jgi:SAM-dependent methyltransferase
MSKPQCPACRATTVHDLGPLSEPPPTFGGQPFPTRPPPRHLWHCMECHLRFRSPYLSQAELTALYEGLPGWVWSTSEDSPRWRNVRALCERYSPGHTILDVGCFTGDFLDRMPPGWIKLGIEPGHGARQIAERRNIKIIAHSVELATNCKADVITMLDVIEHFVNPLQQLSKASSLLRSGGCIVVSTGNADAISFRLLSNNYWYCSIPEHVSFLSKRWFEWAAQRLDMKVQACEYVAADAFDLHRWLRDGVRNTLFALVQRLRARV